MNTIFLTAGRKAEKLRIQLGVNMFEPLNVYDACDELGILVRFVDVNMEGLYLSTQTKSQPEIWLSNQRPLSRRSFTCAHELGHHCFNHGSKIDELDETNGYTRSQNNEEKLVNAFAGALLMPIAGIQAELNKRKWKPDMLSPINYFVLSS